MSGPGMENVQGDFPASAGKGTVNGIPAGADRTLTFHGLDSDGIIAYEGNITGITIIAGQTTDAGKADMYSITPPDPPYTDNGDGTVTDNVTGLMWQQQDDNQTYNWYEASGSTYPAELNPNFTDVCGSLTLAGYTDWRLPSKEELIGLIYCGPDSTYTSTPPMQDGWNCSSYGAVQSPTIDTTYFPNTEVDIYWSSNTAWDLTIAWHVHFFLGNVDANNPDKSGSGYVRCVREEQ